MKKLLSFLGSLSLIAVSAATVIACGNGNQAAAQKLDLTEHLSTYHIADFGYDQITDNDLLDKAKRANPNLNINEVEIKHTLIQVDGQVVPKPNEAVLTVKKDSKVYNPGSAFVFYTVPKYPRVALSSVLRQTDLGEILRQVKREQVLLSDVRTRLKELNPALRLEYVNLKLEPSEINGGTVTLTLKPENPYFAPLDQKTILTYQFQKTAVDLSKVVSQTNLGFLDYYADRRDTRILSIIEAVNPYLDIKEIKVISKDRSFNGQIRITPIDNSKKYNPGFFDFSFTPKVNIDLEQDLKQLDLGIFDDEPTDQQILTRIKELNPLVDLNEIYVASNSADKIIIREKFGSTKYWQTKMELSYKVKDHFNLQDIWNVIEKTNLGELDVTVNAETVILNKLKELNPLLDLNHLGVEQLQVIQHRNGFATIKVVDGSLIYSPGSVEISYINKNRISLKDAMKSFAIQNTMMGFNETKEDAIKDQVTIFKNIKFFNLGLDIDQIEIISIKPEELLVPEEKIAQFRVTFAVKKESNIYKLGEEPVERNFNLFKKRPLSSWIVKRNLGSFPSIPTFDELWIRIFEKNQFTNNPDIFYWQANLVNDGEGHVKLSVAFPGFEVVTGTVDLTYTIA